MPHRGLVFQQTPPAGTEAPAGAEVVATLAMEFTVNETATVPDLVGNTQAGATEKLTAAGLTGTFTFAPDPTRDDEVIAQGIPAGQEVALGTAVPVTVAQLELPAVPNVIGLEAEAAAAAIKAAGFASDITTAQSSTAPGRVFEQTPTGGTRAQPGSVVSATVATPEVTNEISVPDVTGLTLDDAGARLAAVGLRAGTVVDQAVTEGKDGIVIKQDLAPGTLVAPDTAIDLTVARLAQGGEIEVPNLLGTALRSTRSLRAVGETNVDIAFSGESGTSFRVMAQEPKEGETKAVSGTVTLTVRTVTSWEGFPQRGVGTLFQFAKEWLSASPTEEQTAALAKSVSQRTIEDMEALLREGPEMVGEVFNIPDRALAQAFAASLRFGIDQMTKMQ